MVVIVGTCNVSKADKYRNIEHARCDDAKKYMSDQNRTCSQIWLTTQFMI